MIIHVKHISQWCVVSVHYYCYYVSFCCCFLVSLAMFNVECSFKKKKSVLEILVES